MRKTIFVERNSLSPYLWRHLSGCHSPILPHPTPRSSPHPHLLSVLSDAQTWTPPSGGVYCLPWPEIESGEVQRSYSSSTPSARCSLSQPSWPWCCSCPGCPQDSLGYRWRGERHEQVEIGLCFGITFFIALNLFKTFCGRKWRLRDLGTDGRGMRYPACSDDPLVWVGTRWERETRGRGQREGFCFVPLTFSEVLSAEARELPPTLTMSAKSHTSLNRAWSSTPQE